MTTTVPTRHSTLEITGDLAVFTLNRPEVRNCLSLQLSDELVAALEKIRRADSVKFLVLRGAGSRDSWAGAWPRSST